MTIAEGTQRLPVQALRELFLFEKLSDEQLRWLAEHGWVTEAPSGDSVLAEGTRRSCSSSCSAAPSR